MIDMHSHILPGIDDGARDLDEALALLRLAEADGVTTQVLTPHIHPVHYDNTLASIRLACERLAQAAGQVGLTIRLEFAAEIRIGPEIVALVEAEQVPWLGVWEGRSSRLGLRLRRHSAWRGRKKYSNWPEWPRLLGQRPPKKLPDASTLVTRATKCAEVCNRARGWLIWTHRPAARRA